MTGRVPRWWPTEGDEPNSQSSLANERTLLAYQRTALGLVVAGLAIAGSHAVADTPAWLAFVGLPLIVLGGGVAIEGRTRYLQSQRAMRTGEELGAPRVVAFLPWGIAVVAVLGLVLATIQLFT